MIDSERAVISLTGENVYAFLQRLITQDINKLNNNNSVLYSCLLNSSGRFVSDFFLHYRSENIVLIDININFIEFFLKKMNFYNLKKDISIIHENDMYITIKDNFWQEMKNGQLSGRMVVMRQDSYKIWNKSDLHYNRILNCIADGYYDLEVDKSIILEFGFDEIGAIDFDKGCYVGQELITRTKRTGTVRKKIIYINISNDQLPENSKMLSSAKDAGLVLVKIHL